MTKNELKNYAIKHGCEIILPDHTKADIIRFKNPKNKKSAYLRLPFNDRQLRGFTICKFCSELGIPIPDKHARLEKLNDYIDGK
ncbi:MAG: hypothetical protein ACOCUV_03790 [bacterium]